MKSYQRNLRKPKFNDIASIQPMQRYNLIGKVLEVGKTIEVKRVEGDNISMAKVKIGDKSGMVNILLKGKQLECAKKDQTIIVRNAMSKVVNEHIRMEVDIWGKVEISKKEDEVKEVNTKTDISATEYEAKLQK